MTEQTKITLLNCDCMTYMATLPDKAFDLVLVDPPYGIGAGGINFKNGSSKSEKPYFKADDWDTGAPDKSYFDELITSFKESNYMGRKLFFRPFGGNSLHVVLGQDNSWE